MTPVDTELPKDARALKALALAQRATILDQQATLLEQQATLELLRARSRELEAKALKFQDLYFGRSSEKTRSTATAEDFKQIPALPGRATRRSATGCGSEQRLRFHVVRAG